MDNRELVSKVNELITDENLDNDQVANGLRLLMDESNRERRARAKADTWYGAAEENAKLELQHARKAPGTPNDEEIRLIRINHSLAAKCAAVVREAASALAIGEFDASHEACGCDESKGYAKALQRIQEIIVPSGEQRAENGRPRVLFSVPDEWVDPFGSMVNELRSAIEELGAFHSAHEGYAVIRQELDEAWDEIKRNNLEAARREMIQVAAMAIRFLVDLTPKE
jgi:hypothetical protein